MYITGQDIGLPEDLLIMLTDDEGAGSPDADRIDNAIRSAQGVVDGALKARYDTPLADPPEIIKKLTRDIAVHELHLRVGRVSDTVRQAFDDARSMLASLAVGISMLDVSGAGTRPDITSSSREFTRGYMEDL